MQGTPPCGYQINVVVWASWYTNFVTLHYPSDAP